MRDKILDRLKKWYWFPFVGILFIVLGIIILFTPFASFLTLAWLVSLGLIVSGIVDSVYSISSRKQLKSWGWSLAVGILTFLLGFHLFFRPGLTALVICYYLGFWLLFRSILQIGSSIDIKDAGVKGWGWMLAFGIVGIIFSLMLLWNPAITTLAVSYWIGSGVLLLGLLQIILGFSLKRLKTKLSSTHNGFKGSYYTDYEDVSEERID